MTSRISLTCPTTDRYLRRPLIHINCSRESSIMGICPHCMQAKPITANKCPYCHERTGLLESLWWAVFHIVVKWAVIIFGIVLLYRCTAGMPPP